MNALMKCPCCGSYMDRGHLTAGGHRILWTAKERRWSSSKIGDDMLVQRMSIFSGALDNIAWRCRGCQKILVDCGENGPS